MPPTPARWAALLCALSLLPLPGCLPRSPPAAPAGRLGDGFLPGAGGVRLHYRVLGSGPPVVVVHGGPGAGIGSLLPELRPLAERFTLILYDQRGGGLSELPEDTALLGLDEHVADLEAVRRFFALDRMKLVAHSFGALVAAGYARAHPERVERIAFSAAVAPLRSLAAPVAGAAPPPAAEAAARERQAEVLSRLLAGTSTDPAADCRAYERLGRRLARARGEPARWRGTSCAMPAEAIRYAFHHTMQVGPRSLGDWDFTGSLARLEAPLLVIHGALDAAGHEGQQAWARAAPNGRLLVLPEASRGASADRPDLFFPALAAFLAGAWPTGAVRPTGWRA
jgi:proline iminopeptidase